jgi:hypothetical protein
MSTEFIAVGAADLTNCTGENGTALRAEWHRQTSQKLDEDLHRFASRFGVLLLRATVWSAAIATSPFGVE